MNSKILSVKLDSQEIYAMVWRAARKGAYVSYIRGNQCSTEEKLISSIASSFQFPSYFGDNWVAVDECLCDLDWLAPKALYIVVDDFSSIGAAEQNCNGVQSFLADLLDNMAEYWDSQEIPIEIYLNN